MKSFIIKIVLLFVFICSLYGNVSPKQNATNKRADMEKHRYATTNAIMEMYYKEHIPEEFCDAFIYYTRTCPDIRQEFYSIMVHESGNFKSYVNKNANGSYDLGPSQLNSYNLKNKYCYKNRIHILVFLNLLLYRFIFVDFNILIYLIVRKLIDTFVKYI